MYGVVYKITNTINGKSYVGLTKRSLTRRWNNHKCAARRGVLRPLYNSMRKHGENVFCVEPLYAAMDHTELVRAEKYFILHLAPEYNLTNGGELTAGRLCRESIEKSANSRRGLKASDTHRRNMSLAHKQAFASNPEQYLKNIGAAHVARRKPVMCIETGVVYPSCTVAAKEIGATQAMVGRVANGLQTHTKGYRFEFVEE